MAFIAYHPEEALPEAERIADRVNIIHIYCIHAAVMRHRKGVRARCPCLRHEEE